MARMLGDAFVVINPDTRNFRASADRQIKQALAGLKPTIPVGVDVEGAVGQIRSLQAKIRQLGLADFLDINIPTGRLITQIQLIKRLLSQAKIADLLEVNLDRASLARQLALIQNLTQTIPVKFDLGKLPVLGPLQTLTQHIPVKFDISRLPVLGPVSGLSENLSFKAADLTSARNAFAALGLSIDAVQGRMGVLDGSMMKSAATITTMGQDLLKLDTALKDTAGIYAALAGADRVLAAGTQLQTSALATEAASFRLAAAANKELVVTTAAAIPLWKATGGWWGALTGKVQLFGGALTAAGVPAILATASGLHVLIDAAIELAAVIVPATIALAAFGAGAAPTINDIQKKMQAVFITSTALNQAIYPMSNSFKQFEDAVKPSVLQLFGEALVVVTQNTGLFQAIAVQTGKALDQLGARAAVALTSGGMAAFLKQGPADLAKIGDIIGNIFGTIGNLLHVIPGYAQVLLNALDAVTKGIEAFTGSGIGQWAAGAFLAFHGFVLWAGLAATAAVYLGNGLIGLAAKFGLAEAGALAFDAAAFGTGIKVMLAGILNLVAALFAMDAAEAGTAIETGILAGAFAALDAVNPLVWVGLAAAAIGALVYALTRTTSATNAYNTAVKNALGQAPVSQLSIDLVNRMADTTGLLRAAQDQLNHTQEYAVTVNTHTGDQTRSVTKAYADQAAIVSGYKGELSTLAGYQANYNTLVKAAGGNLSYLSAAGITSNDIMNAGAQQMKQYIIEVQAAADAQKALGLGIGRSAAAQNAQTNLFITETLPAMQKVTGAEDTVINTILSGEQAFIGFQQSLATMGKDAKVAGASLGGLNAQSLTLGSDFYSTVVPALQKTVNAAQQMGVSTGDLTTIIATQAGEIAGWTSKNAAARSVMVALINNALGPGTVSMQSLDKWVAQNSTSQQGLNAIWAKATILAGTLAGVLQNDLNAQFAQALLKSSGADQAIRNLTDAIVHGGTSTQAYRSARQQLIQDLINTGMNATQARQYVDNLQRSIDAMHGKTVQVGMYATASGQVTASENIPGFTGTPAAVLAFHAAGGKIRGGTPGKDSVLGMLMPGEVVVPTAMVNAGAVDHLRGRLPGFAGGGVVGQLVPWGAQAEADFGAAVTAQWAKAVIAQFSKQAAKAATAAATVGNYRSGAGVQQWRGTVSQALAMAGSSQQLIDAVLYQMQTESGGNPYAVNLTDINAQLGHPSVGLMQVIAGTYAAYGAGRMGYPPPVAYGVSEQGLANTYAAIKYAQANYGPGLRNAYGGIGTGRGYAHGGLVGYATGGTVASQGAAFLRAWQTRHGGGFGAAWGPIPVNPQIDAMSAMLARSSTLAGAGGLSGTQRRHYAALAADERKRLAALVYERAQERAWRSQLSASDVTLSSWIGAAGATPSLAVNVRAWKAQRARQQKTIGDISWMLGLSAAQIASAQKAGTLGPGGAALPAITHTYGAITDVIEAFLQAHAAPFTGKARGGLVMSYDSGGYLPPGLSMAWNGLGRPEPVGQQAVAVQLQVSSGGGSAFDQFMVSWLRKQVKVKGGGSVQKAFGTR